MPPFRFHSWVHRVDLYHLRLPFTRDRSSLWSPKNPPIQHWIPLAHIYSYFTPPPFPLPPPFVFWSSATTHWISQDQWLCNTSRSIGRMGPQRAVQFTWVDNHYSQQTTATTRPQLVDNPPTLPVSIDNTQVRLWLSTAVSSLVAEELLTRRPSQLYSMTTRTPNWEAQMEGTNWRILVESGSGITSSSFYLPNHVTHTVSSI